MGFGASEVKSMIFVTSGVCRRAVDLYAGTMISMQLDAEYDLGGSDKAAMLP